MKLTNHTGLPQPIFDAVKNDGYSRGIADVSVTELISPPRKVALEAKHHEEMEEDCSDRIWSLLGQSIHTILERANVKGIAERRLSIEVAGWKISGGMDLVEENGTLVDYKTTSAWSCKDGVKPEWEQQLNIYAEILRQNGTPPKGLKVIAILRDWSKLEAKRSPDYPQRQVVSFQVPLWLAVEAQTFIRERVGLHQASRTALPLCTASERWAKPPVFAVMKPGRKSAVKLCFTAEEAKIHCVDPTYTVVERPGANTRCESYCNAAPFCSQYQTLKQGEEK